MDTSAWVALVFPRDSNHREAAALYRRLSQERVTLVTTDYVMDETLTLLRSRGFTGKRMAAFRQEIEAACKQSSLRLLMTDESAFHRTWDFFLKHESLGASFTDCHLALAARRIEADGIFSFDSHFEAMGFRVLPEP